MESEIKTKLEVIEKLVEDRVSKEVSNRIRDSIELKQFDIDSNTIKVDRKSLVSRLERVKEEIKDRYEEALKLWEKATEVYAEIMKKQLGSKALKFPEKPRLPSAHETICGYIDLFESIVEKEIRLEMSYLEGIFLDTKESINKQREELYYLGACTSGTAYGVANFSLGMDDTSTGVAISN